MQCDYVNLSRYLRYFQPLRGTARRLLRLRREPKNRVDVQVWELADELIKRGELRSLDPLRHRRPLTGRVKGHGVRRPAETINHVGRQRILPAEQRPHVDEFVIDQYLQNRVLVSLELLVDFVERVENPRPGETNVPSQTDFRQGMIRLECSVDALGVAEESFQAVQASRSASVAVNADTQLFESSVSAHGIANLFKQSVVQYTFVLGAE